MGVGRSHIIDFQPFACGAPRNQRFFVVFFAFFLLPFSVVLFFLTFFVVAFV